LIEHGLTSPPTQYRLYGRRFYRSEDPTNSIKVPKEQRYSSTHSDHTVTTDTSYVSNYNWHTAGQTKFLLNHNHL